MSYILKSILFPQNMSAIGVRSQRLWCLWYKVAKFSWPNTVLSSNGYISQLLYSNEVIPTRWVRYWSLFYSLKIWAQLDVWVTGYDVFVKTSRLEGARTSRLEGFQTSRPKKRHFSFVTFWQKLHNLLIRHPIGLIFWENKIDFNI